jgi:hypothetical protein
MYLLLSGEGPGDIGVCYPANDSCERSAFREGPMAIMVDQLVELFQGYEMSHLDTDRVSYVSKSCLSDYKRPARKKSMSLKGKKKSAETRYYFENARVLASLAKVKSAEIGDQVIAVLFRDADGTASAGRGNWSDKRDSMINGFEAENFDLGVAMIPKPKSEAWLLCAIKENPYQHCDSIEDGSGNDRSSNPLKEQLEKAIDGNGGRDNINQLVADQTIDIRKIDMPSFNTFKEDLKRAVDTALGKSI